MTKECFLKALSEKTDSARKTYFWCDLDLSNALVCLVKAGFSDEEVDFIVGRASAWANSQRPVGHLDKEETEK